MSLDYDKAGYCIKCGEFQLEERVIESIKQWVKKKSYGLKKYDLSDGSQMNVLMCTTCQTLPDNEKEIMGKVIKGWQHEIDHVIKDKWSDEKKKSYMDKYGKLDIKSNKVDELPNKINGKKEKK